MKPIRALLCAATIALLAPAAGAGVVQVYPPYSHLVEANVSSTVFGAGDGFLIRGDDTTSFDGALRWSLSFAVGADVRSMTGDATFAVPDEVVPDGIADASLSLYRATEDEVARGDFGELVHSFDIDVAGSWAHAALDGALLPLGPGLVYSFVFAGESVANPYLQARMDFRGAPLEGQNPPPAVPEPHTLLLFLAGAGGIGFVLRRRAALTPGRA